MLSEHGIPETLHSENGPQYASAWFADICTSWDITHETSSPHYPQSNGFAEVCVKSVKHALQCAMYSGANLQLTLLALQVTPIDAKLPSPAELLYQHQPGPPSLPKSTTLTQQSSQVCKWIDTHSDTFGSQAGKHCKSLAHLYAGQLVAMYDTLYKIWVPTTVVCILAKDCYQVCTSDGTIYHHETTPAWMQCQTCWHYSRCYNTHATGACQTPCLCATAYTNQICTTSATHICCICHASDSKATGHSCSQHASCPKGCPCTYACDT